MITRIKKVIASALTVLFLVPSLAFGTSYPRGQFSGTGTDNRYALFDGSSVLEGGLLSDDGTDLTQTGSGDYILPDAGGFRFTTEPTGIYRDAAAELGQRDSTNAQSFHIYGTFTDSSNYARASISHDGTNVIITPEEAGTGADSQHLKLNAIGPAGEIHFDSIDVLRFHNNSFNFMRFIGAAGSSSATQMKFQIPNNMTDTSGTQVAYAFEGTWNNSSGTPKQQFMTLKPVINWSSPDAGNYEVLFLNSTESAIPTGTNYLIRAQVDAGDIFSVTTTGDVETVGQIGTTVVTTDVNGDTTFVVSSNVVQLTCTGAETITTITGGLSGQLLTLLHEDSDCTINDTDDDTANQIDMLGVNNDLAGAADLVVQLVYTGSHWLAVSESQN